MEERQRTEHQYLQNQFNERSSSNFVVIEELRNVKRFFTKQELSQITQDYSYLLSKSIATEIYKGILDDATIVMVKKCCQTNEDVKHELINEAFILSQIVHKNIIKLLGCCLEDYILILVYDYADKGSLSDILQSEDDFPLESRLDIAVMTAEALECLQSSEGGIILHGSISPSNILLDHDFTPKVTGFTNSRRLAKEEYQAKLLVDDIYTDPIALQSGFLGVKSDVYSFGIVLFQIISRKEPIYGTDCLLVTEFKKAYQTHCSGEALFDADITSDEDIAVLEKIGRLALECTSFDIHERPEMNEVAERLRMIRSTWKKRAAKGAACVSSYCCWYKRN